LRAGHPLIAGDRSRYNGTLPGLLGETMSFVIREREPILWGLWMLWLGVWVASALWTAGIRRTAIVRRGDIRSQLAQIACAIPIALIWEARIPWLKTPLLAAGFAPLGLSATALGIALSFWARSLLNRNWSGLAVIRAGHELVERGPYRYVRHPIYSGILLALAGTVIALGAPPRWIAIGLLILAVFLLKIQSEERLLASAFGERFASFRRKTPALFPRPWGRPGSSA